MAYSILVIEDNPDVSHVVQHELEQAGFTAYSADTGSGGLDQARELAPDLVILDLGLPDFDGAEVARRLRLSTSVPIIILTAVDAIERKVELFGFGANDYLTKPFDSADLIRRVNQQLRQANAQDVARAGELEVHLQGGRALFRGQEVPLAPREFDVLSLLVRQPGRIFSREQLAQRWGLDAAGQPGPIEDVMGSLRDKLRAAGAPDMLRTARGLGYALRLPSQETVVSALLERSSVALRE